MRTINRSTLILIGLLAVAILSISLPIPADAALPPRPTLTPPSAPTVEPTPAPTAEPTPAPTPTPVAQPAEAPLPVQATLLLYAGPGYDGAWAVIQWQGGDGVWHDVTGWRGHVRGGQVRWQVAEKDFGTGPFRWAVYDKEGGALRTLSALFSLPTSGDQQLVVTVKNE